MNCVHMYVWTLRVVILQPDFKHNFVSILCWIFIVTVSMGHMSYKTK